MTRATPRPVILLHGCGGSRRASFEQTGWLEALAAAGRSAIALDLPGHADKAASRDPAGYADLAGLMAHALPAGPLDAVGFSLGAKILLEIAVREPERVRRLVLGGVGDNVFAPEHVAEAAARALELGPTPDTPEAVKAFLQTWDPGWSDALAVAAVLRRPPNPTFTTERLRQVVSPVLIVNGSEDPVTRQGDRLLASLADARRVTLPGVDHFGLPGQREFIQHALAFLASDLDSERAPSKTAVDVNSGPTSHVACRGDSP